MGEKSEDLLILAALIGLISFVFIGGLFLGSHWEREASEPEVKTAFDPHYYLGVDSVVVYYTGADGIHQKVEFDSPAVAINIINLPQEGEDE